MTAFQCIFCKQSLPLKLDTEFQAHMAYHRAEFNQEFIFAALTLDTAGLERTIEFMLSQIPTDSQEAKDEKKKAFQSYFNVTETHEGVVKEDQIDTQENKVEDNIIDDGLCENSAAFTRDKQGNDNTINQARDEPSLEKLIQDDNQNVDNLIEESSFPAAVKEEAGVGGVVDQPKRKRGRPRKVKVEAEQLKEMVELNKESEDKPKKKRGRKKKESCSCNIVFKNASSRRKHFERYHSPFPCDKCTLTFKTEKELAYHKEFPKDRHDQDYMSTTCFTCGAKFKLYRFLKDHKKSVHEIGEKRKCELCPEWVTNLKKHLRKYHTEIKVCDICEKPVKSLENHKLTMHGTDEDKKYRCEECGKGFILRDKLVAHAVVHSKEKPFKCRFSCGYASKTAGNLRKHHEGVHKAELEIEKCVSKGNSVVRNENILVEVVDESAQEKVPLVTEKYTKKENFENEIEDEEDIDLDDLEEVSFTNGLPARAPVVREAKDLFTDYQAPTPTQLIQVSLPLNQILATSTALVQTNTDPDQKDYQDICSYFTS